ncbi:MAG: hypothetical protein IRY86_08790 [Thermorudis peleae]|nr:hypothetical protein [Thermorudis peleae]
MAAEHSSPMIDPAIALAKAIAGALVLLPGCVRLDAGQFGPIATYGPGERVDGIAVTVLPDRVQVTVALVARYDPSRSLFSLADEVREVVSGVAQLLIPLPVRPIDVVITDLEAEGQG